MPFTVNVTDITPVITATSTISSFTITETNQTFNITTLQPAITITNQVSNIEFNSDGGMGFDFITKNVGDWVSGSTYSRNDIVRYQYSLYIADTAFTATFTSTIAPPLDPTYWEPFWTTDWTFPKLRTDALKVGGMNYAATTATAGYVLTALDSTTSYWTSLGSLVFWDLSDDLRTNGFNIVTGSSTNDPNPQLTIGSGAKNQGDNPANLKSYLKFHSVPTASTTGKITIKGETTFTNQVNVKGPLYADGYFFGRSGEFGVNLTVQGDQRVYGDVRIAQDLWLYGINRKLYIDPSVTIRAYDNTAPGGPDFNIRIGKGIRFGDGSTLESAYGLIGTGTGTLSLVAGTGIDIAETTTTYTISAKTATTSERGAIRLYNGSINPIFDTFRLVGDALFINTATQTRIGGVRIGEYLKSSDELGTLTINTATLVPYLNTLISIPTASASTLGGIKVGSGLAIDGSGVLSVTTATTGGAISLTQDMLTNGYWIKYANTTTNSELLISNNSITMAVDTVPYRGMTINGTTSELGYNINTIFRAESDKITAKTQYGRYESTNLGSGIYYTTTSSAVLNSTSADITANQINLKSRTQTVVGADIYNSELQVSKIYNYSGTGPPFFPEGIQMPDNTVQITAYRADQGLIP